MIQETCLQIDRLQLRWQIEREQRYARRNKIRQIDELLNEFEMLNLAEEPDIPRDLAGRVRSFLRVEEHPLTVRSASEVAIAEWMEALYEVQDTLMLTVEDDID